MYHTGRPRRYNFMICSQYCNGWAVYVGCAVIFGNSALTWNGWGSTQASAGKGISPEWRIIARLSSLVFLKQT